MTEVDDDLLIEIKELDTVEDVKTFWGVYGSGSIVEEQVNLTSTFNEKGTEGYIMRRSNNVTSFLPYIPKDMCEQFIYTQLTLELKQASRRDYTEVNSSTVWCDSC